MDKYLKCLYDHVMEHLLTDTRRNMFEYNRCSLAQEQAWGVLKSTLTPEQLELLEDYQAARTKVCALEEEWLFQESITLGKWLAQT